MHDAEKEIEVDELLEWCRQVGAQGVDGITISGGEPFEQPEALSCLLSKLRSWADELPEPVDFLCYSGMPYRRICENFPQVLVYLDAIIPEPFVSTLPHDSLRGSSNQSIVALTPLGRDRYGAQIQPTKRFQTAVDQDCVWFIGIPEKGDMDRVESYCKDRGVTLNGVSWRA